MKVSCYGLHFKVLSWNLPQGNGKNPQKTQPEQLDIYQDLNQIHPECKERILLLNKTISNN
jgi:hypothetical protein